MANTMLDKLGEKKPKEVSIIKGFHRKIPVDIDSLCDQIGDSTCGVLCQLRSLLAMK